MGCPPQSVTRTYPQLLTSKPSWGSTRSKSLLICGMKWQTFSPEVHSRHPALKFDHGKGGSGEPMQNLKDKPRVVSICVSMAKTINLGRAQVATGIFKEPVAGKIRLSRLNLDGDEQADLSVHGGPDKA